MSQRVRNYLFTSESVTEGHPDKMADQISDAVVDAVLAQDPLGRVACETVLTTGLIFIAGEITSKATVEYAKLARRTVERIGYTRAKFGFDAETCAVMTAVHEQSPDIAMGVDPGGAGDQGMMFGYACNETEELMPLPIMLAHKLVRGLSEVRRSGKAAFLRPDGKSQVSVRYEDGKPVQVTAVVVSSQHSDSVPDKTLQETIREEVIRPVLPEAMLSGAQIHINPTGRFVTGGPAGDTGLTGRKIIVDTYGGMGRARRRSLLRQGPLEGGPLGLLHGPAHCEEHRGGRGRRALRSPVGLRHRSRRAGIGDGGRVRDRAGGGRKAGGPGPGDLSPHAARHY